MLATAAELRRGGKMASSLGRACGHVPARIIVLLCLAALVGIIVHTVFSDYGFLAGEFVVFGGFCVKQSCGKCKEASSKERGHARYRFFLTEIGARPCQVQGVRQSLRGTQSGVQNRTHPRPDRRCKRLGYDDHGPCRLYFGIQRSRPTSGDQGHPDKSEGTGQVTFITRIGPRGRPGRRVLLLPGFVSGFATSRTQAMKGVPSS